MDIRINILALIESALIWTNIRAIGNSTPAKLTILIPLIGYLIIFNEYAIQYFSLSKELFGSKAHQVASNASQISLRLLSIYFGLCTVASASLIYAIFCPREIKRHGSSEEYVGGDGKNLSAAQLRALSRQIDGKDNKEKAFIDFAVTLNQPSITGTAATKFRENNEEIEVEGVRLFFEKKNKSWPAARCACAILYLIGLGILAIPSAEIFLRAFSLLINKLT